LQSHSRLNGFAATSKSAHFDPCNEFLQSKMACLECSGKVDVLRDAYSGSLMCFQKTKESLSVNCDESMKLTAERVDATISIALTPQTPSSSANPGKQLWTWLLALCALALLGYPMVRSLTQRDNAPAPVSTPSSGLAALLDRSFEQYQAGKFPESIVTAQEALKLEPHSELAYNNIAAAYGSMQMWDDAIRNAREALRIRPDFALAQNNLAWFTKARQSAAAMTSTPVSPTAAARLNASLEHYNAGRYQQCIEAAREALKLKSDYPEAYNNIAAGYIRLENWDEAIKNARESLRLKPDFTLARNNLNVALEHKAGKH
jgi:tetratricopeptide (TPR) repeat protein